MRNNWQSVAGRGCFFLLGIFFLLDSGYAQLKFDVIDDDGVAVPAFVRRIDNKNNLVDLGPTDPDGHFESGDACQTGVKIVVQPEDSETYFRGGDYCVRIKNQVKVTKKPYYKNLLANAESLEKSGKKAQAALVYSEIAFRAQFFNTTEALEAQEKSLVLLGDHFEIESPTVFDAVQQKNVMSEDLKAKLKDYQVKERIRETGNADYTTFSRAAKTSVNLYLFDATKIGLNKKEKVMKPG